MASLIGALRVTLGLDSAAFEKGATAAEKRAKGMERSLKKFGDGMTKFGAVMTVGITAPFVALMAKALPAAEDSAKATGQVTAALASMGDAAKRTLPQLQAQATALMKISTFDDDDIMRKVTANMLTFGNITGDVFDRAQLAVVNLSARMGTDLQSATIMIGKALNDPAKGLAALRRVGIQFTEQQQDQIKAMVKAGNAAGAQAIMLKELERQYGGSAKAMRDATPGIEAKQAWDDFQETIGKFALEILPPLTELLAKLLNGFNELSPGTQKFTLATVALLAVLGPVLTIVGGLISVFGVWLVPIVAIGAAVAYAVTHWTAFKEQLIRIAPVFGPVISAAEKVVWVFRNWDKIVDTAKAVYTGIKTWFQDKLGAIFDWVGKKVEMVTGFFRGMYDAVVGHSYVPDMVVGIAAHMARLENVMVLPAKKATKATSEAFKKMAEETKALLDRLWPEAVALREFRREMALLEANKDLSPEMKEEGRQRLIFGPTYAEDAADSLKEQMAGLPTMASLVPTIDDLIAKLPKLGDKAKVTAVRVAKSFGDMAQEVAHSFQSLTQSIKGGGFLDILSAGLSFLTTLGGAGAFGKTVQSRINAVPGLASGGSFMVGGKSGIDGNVLSINGQPRAMVSGTERVTVSPPGNDNGGRIKVDVVPSPYFDVRVTQVAGPMVVQGMGAASNGAQTAMARKATRSLRR